MAPTPHPVRGRAWHQQGVTLVELGAALALAAAVLAGVLTLAASIREGVAPIAVAKRVDPWVDVLQRSVTRWYRDRHCQAGATPLAWPIALDDAVAATACASDPTDCLPAFVPPQLARLQPGLPAEDGAFAWRLATPAAPAGVLPPPRVQISWTPPSHLRRDAERIARELDVFCDDDGDVASAEPCDGTPAGERLVWDHPLEAQLGTVDTRQRRLFEWLASNAVDCDADDNTAMDRFCDGPLPDGRIDADLVVEVDGDNCDDAHARPAGSRCADPVRQPNLLDRNADGQLDFDVNGDLAVDQADFHALGC